MKRIWVILACLALISADLSKITSFLPDFQIRDCDGRRREIYGGKVEFSYDKTKVDIYRNPVPNAQCVNILLSDKPNVNFVGVFSRSKSDVSLENTIKTKFQASRIYGSGAAYRNPSKESLKDCVIFIDRPADIEQECQELMWSVNKIFEMVTSVLNSKFCKDLGFLGIPKFGRMSERQLDEVCVKSAYGNPLVSKKNLKDLVSKIDTVIQRTNEKFSSLDDRARQLPDHKDGRLQAFQVIYRLTSPIIRSDIYRTIVTTYEENSPKMVVQFFVTLPISALRFSQPVIYNMRMPWEFKGNVTDLTLIVTMNLECKKYCEYRLVKIGIHDKGNQEPLFVGRRSEKLPADVTALLTREFFQRSVSQMTQRLKENMVWWLTKFDRSSAFD